MRASLVAGIVAMVLAALVISPDASTLRLGGIDLPVVCTLRATTGYPCPGCGLTRSIVWAVHGELRASFASHRLGPALLLWLLAEAVRHGLWLAFSSRRVAIDRAGRWLDRAGLLFLPAFLFTWIWDLM